MGRKKQGEGGDDGKPLLKFEPPVSRSKVSVNIKDQLKEYLRQYPAFVEKTTGVKVTEDEVAEQIFERFFRSDKAFLASLEAATNGSGSGAGGGARGGAARPAAASTSGDR